MFEADYDDDNADEYACMHADGLLEDLCPGWNLTQDGVKDVKKQHTDTELLCDLMKSMRSTEITDMETISKTFCSVV